MAYPTSRKHARWLCSAGLAALFASGAHAQEAPSGGQVVAGSATIGGAGANVAIRQASGRAVIDWKSFGVGAGGSVTIDQPDAKSALLNRVTGKNISRIAGTITANGQVFLVNRNGILVTPTGQVDARGGFVASTLDITNEDFMAGRLRFAGANGGLVLNQGRIAGGAVALLGANVGNEGLIVSPLGKVALGSAEQATLDLSGDGYLQVLLPADATDASGRPLVSNSGRIEGGMVVLSAATARAAVRQTVNMSGVIAAKSVSGTGGVVTLDGGPGGIVTVSGELDASGADTGGRIDITGQSVKLTGATLTATGGASGGLVRVGGMFQGGAAASEGTAAQTDTFITRFGALPTLAAADDTSFDAVSVIDVTGGAHGGAAVLWSALSTSQAGLIRAGGVTGGAVELSSKGHLTMDLTRVAAGVGGTVLLDPKNIWVDSDNLFPSFYTASTLPSGGTVNYSDPGADPATTYFKVGDVLALMNAGTDVVLRASNDIQWNPGNAAVDFSFASGGHSGGLTLSAGRSVTIAGFLTLYSSSLIVIANDTAANGVVDADRDPGQASIDTFNGTISAQTGSSQTPGNISLTVGTGAGNTNRAIASLSRLGNISGNNIALSTSGQAMTWAFFPDQSGSALDPVTVAAENAVTISGSISGRSSGGLTFSGMSVTWSDEATRSVSNNAQGFVAFVENGVTTRYGLGVNGANMARVALGQGSAYSAITYGDANPTPVQYRLTAGALRSGDTLATLAAGFDNLATGGLPAAFSAPGAYTLTTSATINRANAPGGYFYNLTSASDTLPINPKVLTPTVTNGNYTYGAPTALVTLAGVINSDVVAPVATLDAATGTAMITNGGGFGFGAQTAAGNHSFTLTGLGGAGAGNYTLDLSGTIAGTIAIARKALTYQVCDTTATYGTAGSTTSALTGVVGGDTVSLAAIASTGFSTTARVGTYAITGSGLGGASAANYDLASSGNIDGVLTIQPKPITYVATGGSSVYGDTPTVATPTFTGIINGDAVTATVLVNGIPNFLAQNSNAGGYGITASVGGTDAANYVLANTGNTAATYTITQRPLSFAVANVTGTYGTVASLVTVSGLTGFDDARLYGQLDGDTLDLNSAGGSGFGYTLASAGTHAFTFNGIRGAAASNYALNLGGANRNATLTVNPKDLTYAITNVSRTFRTSVPLPTINLTGVIGQDFGNVAGQLSINGITATNPNDVFALNAGTYAASLTGLTGSKASNYRIAASGNQLGAYAVTPATIGYSLVNASSTYGTAASLPTPTLSNTYFQDDVRGVVSVSQNGVGVTPGTRTPVGSYLLSVNSLAGANAGNYTIATGNNTNALLTISAKTLTYAVGGNSLIYGQTIPTPPVTLNGLVAGDAVTSSVGLSSNNIQGQPFFAIQGRQQVGTYYLGLIGISGADVGNYVLAQTGNSYGQLTITPKHLTYRIPTGSLIYGDGGALPTAILSGIESGDDVLPQPSLVLAGGQAFSSSSGLSVGTYATTLTTITGPSAFNYVLDGGGAATGSLLITPRTISALTSLVGFSSFVPYGTYRPGDTLATVALNGVLPRDQGNVTVALAPYTLPASSAGLLPVGSYGFTATDIGGSAAFNYVLTRNTAILTVNPAAITANYAPFTSTYGTIAALGPPTLLGVFGDDRVTTARISLSANGSPVALGAQTPAGNYLVTADGLRGADAANYSFSAGTTTLTIARKTITYSIATASSIYGNSPSYGAISFAGLVGADVVSGTRSLVLASRSDVGTYSDTVSAIGGASVANYLLATSGNTTGGYTITPRALSYSVTANTSQTIQYGDPTLRYASLNGVLSGDTVDLAAVTETITSTPDPSSPFRAVGVTYQLPVGGTAGVAGYDITLTKSSATAYRLDGASAPNYVLPVSASDPARIGTLTVTPRQISYTVTAQSTGVYGDTIDYSIALANVPAGLLNQIPVTPLLDGGFHNDIQSDLTVGTHSIAAAIRSVDFQLVSGQQAQVTITPRPLTATLSSASITYGGNATNLLTLTNIVRNDAVLPVLNFSGQSLTAVKGTAGYGLNTVTLNVGARGFTATGLSGAAASNYTLASVVGTGLLIIAPKTLTYSVAPVSGQYGGITGLDDYNGCSYNIVCYLGTRPGFGPGKVTLTGVINNDDVGGTVLVTDGTIAQPYAINLAPGSYAQVVSALTGAKAANYVLASSGNTAGLMKIAAGVVQANVSGGGRIYNSGDRTTYQSIGTPGVVDVVRSTNADFFGGTNPVTGFVAGDDVRVIVSIYKDGQAYTGDSNFPIGTYDFRPVQLVGADAYKYRLLPVGPVGSNAGQFVVSASTIFDFGFLTNTPNVAYTPPASVTTFSASITGSGSGSATTTQTATSYAATASGSGSATATASYGIASISATVGAQAATLASFGVTGVTLSASVGAHAAVTISVGPASYSYGGDAAASSTASLGLGGLTLTSLASANAYQDLTVGGSLGNGVSGSTSSTARVFADAGSTNSATYSNGTVTINERQWVGVGASAGTGGTISGGGVSGSASITVYSPGSLGLGAASTSGYSNGTLTVGFTLAISIGIGGLEISPSFSFDTGAIKDNVTNFFTSLGDTFAGKSCDTACRDNNARQDAINLQNQKFDVAANMLKASGGQPTYELMNYLAANPEVSTKLDSMKFVANADASAMRNAMTTYGNVPDRLNSVVAQEQALMKKIQANPGGITPGDLLQAQSLRAQEATLIGQINKLGGKIQVANGAISMVSSAPVAPMQGRKG